MKTSAAITSVVAIAGLLVVCGSPAKAVPFTDHFDALIADMQSRAVTLSNSTDKVQQKQFKTIQKLIGTLEGKTSTSVATDIKNFGKIANTLAKAFPDDFVPTPGIFSTDLEEALQGLIDDVQSDIDTTQSTLGGLGASSCTEKAQATLTIASNLVVQASAASDFATAAKLLGSGLKSAQKAAAAANKCSSGSSGGGGGGKVDFMKATISGDFSLNFSTLSQVPPFVNEVTIGSPMLFIAGGDPNDAGIGLTVNISGITGQGTYPLATGTNVSRLSASIHYLSTGGSITFTTFDLANQKLVGTFSFTATESGGSGTVTVSSGSFSISTITQY